MEKRKEKIWRTEIYVYNLLLTIRPYPTNFYFNIYEHIIFIRNFPNFFILY